MDTGIKVGDVMGKGIVTIGPGESVKKACELMSKHDLSGVTVMDKGKVVGMLTQGDLIPMIANGQDPGKVSVKGIMGKKLVNIEPGEDISKAAKKMVDNKVKRLPVLKGNRLVGVITQTDILRVSPSVFDLIFEKAKIETGALLEDEIGMSGECEECNNYSENLRNVNGTLVCEECYGEIEEQV
jgi:CBS domain-containing protein